MVYDEFKILDAKDMSKEILYAKQCQFELRDKPGRQLAEMYAFDDPLIDEDDPFLRLTSRDSTSLGHRQFLDKPTETKEIVF